MSTVPRLPPRTPGAGGNEVDERPSDTPPVGGIAARIAALKLEQVGSGRPIGDRSARSGLTTTGRSETLRPPIPRSVSASHADADEGASPLDTVMTSNGRFVQTPIGKKAPPPPPARKTKRVSDSVLNTISAEELTRALRRPSPPVPKPVPIPERVSPIETSNQVPNYADESRDMSEEIEQDRESRSPPPPPPRRLLPPQLPVRRSASNAGSQQSDRSISPQPPTRPPPLPGRRSSTVSQNLPVEQDNLPSHTPPPLPSQARRLPPQIDKSARPPPPVVNRSSRPSVSSEVLPPEQPDVLAEEEQVAEPGETCLKCQDFSAVDTHASLFPRESVTSLPQLAYDLISPFPSQTEKARAIFTWLHQNIAYDAYSFLNNCVKPATPESTLRSGKAVCAGYSDLFADLGLHAGLEVMVVSGHGKGYGYVDPGTGVLPPYAGNHAWNAVLLDDNKWHLIDSTWGAGRLDSSAGEYKKMFSPHCFTMTNEEFGLSHFPEDAGFQLREDGQAISWETYILSPSGPMQYQAFREENYDPTSITPYEKTLKRGAWYTFHIEKTCWHTERDTWYSSYVLFICPTPEERIVMERDDRGPGNGWTQKVWVPSESDGVSLFHIQTVSGKDARGMTEEDVKRRMGREGMSWVGVARWEVT